MNKSTGIAIGIAVIVITVIIAYQVNESQITQYALDYQIVGPLSIDKSKYVLGENVYITFSLHPLEDGIVVFNRPDGKTYHSFDFNGSLKPDGKAHFSFDFNGSLKPEGKAYFRPALERVADMCVKEDIVGTWTVLVTGTTLTEDRKHLTLEPKEMQFEFLDKVLQDSDRYDGNVCEP